MKSIKFKLMLSVVVIIAIFMGALLLANTVFLEDYYVSQTKGAFISTYEEALDASKLPKDEFYNRLRELNDETGYRYSVVESNEIIFSSANNFDLASPKKLTKDQNDFFIANREALKDNQVLYGALENSNKSDNDVQLVGKINKNNFIIITQPIIQLTENARIANSFFIRIGLVMVIVSSILAFFMSKHFVNPILRITNITKEIANLDFSSKYQGKTKDEINQLGENVNIISKKLDNTIDDLKISNNKLQDEMDIQKNFFASVSHEFKTPVGLIRGYCEALQLGIAKTKEEERDITDIIIKESDRMTSLLNDMIYSIRIGSGSFEINKQKEDIVDIVNETLKIVSLPAKNKEIVIIKDLPVVLEANVDKDRIIQVLENLLINAIKYTNQKEMIQINVSDKNDSVYIEVINSGSEIDEEKLEKLFEPFYRVDDSRSRDSGGVGLGLSIVKGIIEAHGGKYGVKNKDDKIMFWIEIPI